MAATYDIDLFFAHVKLALKLDASKEVKITYCDSDGDVCQLTTALELAEAVRLQGSMVHVTVSCEGEEDITLDLMAPASLTIDQAFVDELATGDTISPERLLALALLTHPVLKNEATLLDIPAPYGGVITVVGDIHAQLQDLLHIFKEQGYPSEKSPYLFLGDYVDRGSNSTGVIQLLFACKLQYPEHVSLLRGNHECSAIGRVYGFMGELQEKYGDKIGEHLFNAFVRTFNQLPLAATIGGKILGLHAGLPADPTGTSALPLSAINALARGVDVPVEGPFCDIVWNDPSAEAGYGVSPRGAGHLFGPDITRAFLRDNSLDFIVRSHALAKDGVDYQPDTNKGCVTIFSASNYCGSCDNLGAYMTVDWEMRPRYHTYKLTAAETPVAGTPECC